MKLIACDMDGTLLNNNHAISQYNEDVIKKINKDNKFVIASGRPYTGIKNFIEQLDIASKGNYSITYNGSVVVENDTGKIIFKKTIPGTCIKKAYSLSKKLGIGFLCYDEKGNYVFDGHDTEGTLLEKQIIKPNVVISNFDKVDDEYIKLIFADTKENIDKVQSQIEEAFNDEFNVLRSHVCFLEIVSKQANKGEALKFLEEYLHIDNKDTYAFGDNDNDYPMMAVAGHSYAMKNSPSKKLLNEFEICPSNEDNGVGKTLIDIFNL